MAIRVKLDYLLVDRRVTPTDLADRVGITLANLSVQQSARDPLLQARGALSRAEMSAGRSAGVDAGLADARPGQALTPEIRVMLNWFDELRARVPVR